MHVCRHSEGLVTLETCGRSDEGHDHFQIFGNIQIYGDFSDFQKLIIFLETFHVFFLETFQTFGKY